MELCSFLFEEGLETCKHGVQNTACTPQVDLLIVDLLGKHFRSCEGLRSRVGHHHEALVLAQLGDIEVCNFYVILIVKHKYIAGLDISMTYPLTVKILDGFEYLFEDFLCHILIVLFDFRDAVEELDAFNKFHNHVDSLRSHEELLDPHDIRVSQTFQQIEFMLSTHHSFFVQVAHDLDSVLLLSLPVLALLHHCRTPLFHR